MGLWYPAEPEAVAPPRTHVLVIGTSFYDDLPPAGGQPPLPDSANIFQLTQVESPAISAFRIATWFKQHYNNPRAPLGKIWLLLSPSQRELANSPELSDQAATIDRSITQHAEQDLVDWQKACATDVNNVAVLYAAGHGVILSPEDAFVLLADYTRKAQPLNGSLDIGAIKRGMVGATMANVQIYFSDACRLPAADYKWQELGHGLGVTGRIPGSDNRSTGVFLAATPYEAALALKGRGTLFSQALLDCLDRAAVVRPDDNENSWHVSIDSLTMFLKRQLTALARLQKQTQSMEKRTQGESVTLHIPRQPPKVVLTVKVTPAPNPAYTWIRLWRGDRREAIRELTVLAEHPVVLPSLTPGLYSLDVGFNPPVDQPFENRQGIVVDAWEPPEKTCEVPFP